MIQIVNVNRNITSDIHVSCLSGLYSGLSWDMGKLRYHLKVTMVFRWQYKYDVHRYKIMFSERFGISATFNASRYYNTQIWILYIFVFVFRVEPRHGESTISSKVTMTFQWYYITNSNGGNLKCHSVHIHQAYMKYRIRCVDEISLQKKSNLAVIL